MFRWRLAWCCSKRFGSGNNRDAHESAVVRLDRSARSALLAGSYCPLQSGRLPDTGLPYQLINIAGSSRTLVSLFGGFNLAVALLQCTWIVISVYGIARGWRVRANAKASVSQH